MAAVAIGVLHRETTVGHPMRPPPLKRAHGPPSITPRRAQPFAGFALVGLLVWADPGSLRSDGAGQVNDAVPGHGLAGGAELIAVTWIRSFGCIRRCRTARRGLAWIAVVVNRP